MKRNKNFGFNKIYFEAVYLALIVTLLPNANILSYASPFIVLAWIMIRANSGNIFKAISISTIFFFSWSIFHYISYLKLNYEIHNSIISFITYGSVIVFYIIKNKKLILNNNYSYDRYAAIISNILMIQGIIGVLQYVIVKFTNRFDILAGDAVQGSIGLLTFTTGQAGFGNQIFSINVVFFIIFLIPSTVRSKKVIFSILIGITALFLAEVLHVFISILVSFVILCLLFFINRIYELLKYLIIATLLLLISLYITIVVYPNTVNGFNAYYTSIVSKNDSPKNLAIYKALVELPKSHPEVFLWGIGPGQFSSKAGLISSGEYLSRNIPYFSDSISLMFKEYGYNVWKRYRDTPEAFGNSTMHRPYFSILSFTVEFGAIIMIIFLSNLIFSIFSSKRLFFYYLKKQSNKKAACHLSFSLGIIFFLLIGFFENYWETSQAILPGLLLLNILQQS